MKYFINNFKTYFLASLLSFIIALTLLYPALPKLNTMFIGDSGDNYEYASYIMLFKKNLLEGQFPFEYTNYWRYPVGFEFARSFDSHLTVVLGGIISIFVSSPLSYNLTIISLMMLNGLFSFMFFNYLTKSKILGILGMIIYGFCFYTLARAEAHLNLLFIGGFPLLGFSILRIIKETKIKVSTSIWFFLSLLILALGSKEYLLLAAFFMTIYLLITILFYKNAVTSTILKIKHGYGTIVITGGIFMFLFLIIFWPYISALYNHQLNFGGRSDTLFTSTPSIIDYLIPNRYLNLLSSFINSNTRYSIESAVFLGWVELLIFIFFFVNKKIKLKFKLFLGTLFIIPFILSLGYGKQNLFPLLPYRFLKGIFIFDIFAETNRFFIIFYLIMTSAIVLALAPLKINKRVYGLLLGLIFAGVLLERIPTNILTVPTLDGNYTKIVKNLPGLAVLDLPLNMYYPSYDILSFYYHKPIVNGYFHWMSDGPKEKSFINSNALYDYSCNGLDDAKRNDDELILANLIKHNIKTIVIHKDHTFYFKDCTNVRIRLNRLFSDTIVVAESKEQKQLISNALTGYPKLTLYFPQKGTFNLDGLYIAPDVPSVFNILVDGMPISGYFWHGVGSVNAMELLPRNQLTISVNAGSTITIYSQNLINNTYFGVWYRYEPEVNSTPLLYKSFFQKIYEDEKVIIYQI